ncbi:MAG: hypothetical protein ACK4PR_09975 [Gammaproteobacteria bacterium]
MLYSFLKTFSHKPKGLIRLASEGDLNKVSELRLKAFKSTDQFMILNSELIQTDQYDNKDDIIIATDNANNIVSTLRGGVLVNHSQAEARLEAKLNVDPDFFPALYLSKGATCLDHRNSGIHSVLRYYFLLGLLNSSINSVIGITYQNAPRLNTMQKMGYNFQKLTTCHYTHVKPIEPPILAFLKKENFFSAYNILSNQHQTVIKDYPWVDRELQYSLSDTDTKNYSLNIAKY